MCKFGAQKYFTCIRPVYDLPDFRLNREMNKERAQATDVNAY